MSFKICNHNVYLSSCRKINWTYFKPNQRKAFDIQYATSFRKAINASDWFNIRDKSYVVTLPTGVKSMKGSEITQEIINIRTKQVFSMFGRINKKK